MGPRVGQDGYEKFRPPPGFDPQIFQPVASGYIGYAIPANQLENVTSGLKETVTF